tara:strand:- start:1500 stop:1688 length:189 start_codon:yes stop_codon:yes gene_type:complete
MPRITKEDSSGWPKPIKNAEEREKHIAKNMNGLRFENIVLKGDRKNVVIDWNTMQQLKKHSR